MIEFDPIKGGSILAIAGPLKHLHFICSDPFFNKDTGAVSVEIGRASCRERV